MTMMIILVILVIILLVAIWLLKVRSSYKVIVTVLTVIAFLSTLYSGVSYYNETLKIHNSNFPNYVFNINSDVNLYSNKVKYEINNQNDFYIVVDVFTINECWTIRFHNGFDEYEKFYRYSIDNISGNFLKKDAFIEKINSSSNKVQIQESINECLEDEKIKTFYDNGGYIVIETSLPSY
ncbi:MAG: hypothetical protein SO253_02445 [Bacilli bacterium]|nr:hypothetical protein [Bacilli bacterium]